MARAILFHGAGRPLEIAHFPVPEPRGAEVRIRVSCCNLCGSDLHTHAGRRQEPMPTILGHEIVGCIEAFGPEAGRHDHRGDELAIGTRVSWSIAASCGSCFFCAQELPQKCTHLFKYGHQRLSRVEPFTGGLADVVMLQPGSALFRVPEVLNDPVAASANCATATVAAVLRAGGEVRDRSVLVFGAGMLGLTACAMARSLGAPTVIVSDPDPTRRESATAFGATAACSTDAKEIAAVCADATAGRGVDLALELAGSVDAVKAGLTLTRIGGTLVLAGTVLPTPGVSFDPEAVVRRLLTIRGVHNYAPRDLGTALDFLAGPGKAFPFAELIHRTFPLQDIEAAFQYAHQQGGGRVAVMP